MPTSHTGVKSHFFLCQYMATLKYIINAPIFVSIPHIDVSNSSLSHPHVPAILLLNWCYTDYMSQTCDKLCSVTNLWQAGFLSPTCDKLVFCHQPVTSWVFCHQPVTSWFFCHKPVTGCLSVTNLRQADFSVTNLWQAVFLSPTCDKLIFLSPTCDKLVFCPDFLMVSFSPRSPSASTWYVFFPRVSRASSPPVTRCFPW